MNSTTHASGVLASQPAPSWKQVPEAVRQAEKDLVRSAASGVSGTLGKTCSPSDADDQGDKP